MNHYSLLIAFALSALVSGCQSADPTSKKLPKTQAKDKAALVADKASSTTVEPLTKLQAEVFQRGLKAYRMKSEHLIALLKNDAPPKAILEQSESLKVLALQLVATVRTQQPTCEKYFDAVKEASANLSNLTLEAIERDYHDGAALPKNSDAVCYHGKDLVVHPATVSVLAKAGFKTKDSRQKAENELTEVLTHLDQVKTSVQ